MGLGPLLLHSVAAKHTRSLSRSLSSFSLRRYEALRSSLQLFFEPPRSPHVEIGGGGVCRPEVRLGSYFDLKVSFLVAQFA